MIRKRVKIVLVVLLVLLAIPDVHYFSNYGRAEVGWKFMNFYYIENRYGSLNIEGDWQCFDTMPIPKYSYGYKSMFLDIDRSYDYCDSQEWWRDRDISIFIGVQDWMLDWYFPIFWLSISDRDGTVSFFGFDMMRWDR